MIKSTQIIKKEGKPVFAVIPWDEYQQLISATKSNDNWSADYLPEQVVHDHVIKGVSIIKAWREYLKMTQQEVADAAQMQQTYLARLESSNKLPKLVTIKKIAQAMGINHDLFLD